MHKATADFGGWTAPARLHWRGVLLVLLLALFLRGALFAWPGPVERFIMPDTHGYLKLAEHFGQAMFDPQSDISLAGMSLRRPPGYPLFLRLAGGAEVDLRLAVAVQVLAGACIAVLAALLAARLIGGKSGRRAGLFTGLLLAVDPCSVIYSNLALSETLSTGFMLLGILMVLEALRGAALSGKLVAGALAALCLAAATYVRPVSLYLPLFLLPWLAWRGRSVLGRVALAVGFAALFAVLVGGWMYRNHQLTGRAMFTSMEPVNLNYRAIWALADQQGMTFEDAEAAIEGMDLPRLEGTYVQDVFNNLEPSASVRIMLENPWGLAKSSLRGLLYLVVGPGRAGLSQLLGVESETGRNALAVAALLPLVGIYLLAVWGLFQLCRQRRFGEAAFLLTVLGYLVLLSAAPESYARFRVPLMPYVCVLAGYGLAALRSPRTGE